MNENKALVKAKKQAYRANEISHDEYFLWLSDFIGLNDNLIPFSNDYIKASKDKHLNDCPLVRWDNMDGVVRTYASSKGLGWSLSDTVCCLKAMARRRASCT